MSRADRETLRLACKGLKNREIAEQLGTTEQTIKNRMRRWLKVTECRNRVELAMYALEHPGFFEALQ